jgi:NFU1 iron-sulfur cluster scaffold homolog, mitochondrial
VYSQMFDFFASGHAVISSNTTDDAHVSDTTILDTDDEVVASIKELFETRCGTFEPVTLIYYISFLSSTVTLRLIYLLIDHRRIRPSVQEDGGDIFYVGFDQKSGIVKVIL